jgi:hypothetical protein
MDHGTWIMDHGTWMAPIVPIVPDRPDPQKSIRVGGNPLNDIVYSRCKRECRAMRPLSVPIE